MMAWDEDYSKSYSNALMGGVEISYSKCEKLGVFLLGIVFGILLPFVIPFVAIFHSAARLFNIKKDGDSIFNKLAQYQLLERIGEALPQLIISLIYVVNYWYDNDIDLTINIISLIFSVGSVLLLYTSIKSCCDNPCALCEE